MASRQAWHEARGRSGGRYRRGVCSAAGTAAKKSADEPDLGY